ncbi:MAG TPA: PAS domain-containing protein, partial [Burkholderiales bacterium]|nr:PAS domain-containing protein [Burkholderiales bacterium]
MNRLQLIWHRAIASGAALKTLVAHHATRRKLADEALRESERRFRRLAELSNDFFWETDTEHRYTMLDYGTIHRGQHEKWKKLGKPPWDIPYTSPDEAAWAAHRATIAARKPFVDFAMSRIDRGEERFYELAGEPRFDSGGAFLGYRGVGRETTSRIRAERALRVSEERHARAMLSANAGFWDWDVEKDEYYTSPRFIEMVGFAPGTTFAGREDFHYRSNYFPEDREKWRVGVRKLFAGSGSRLAMEVRVTVAGETRWHAMHGICFRENGKVVRWTGYATDVTERKRAEEALRLSEERYARAIDGADVGHWDCDLVTQEMFVSERAREMLALPEGPLPANWREIMALVPMHPEDRGVMAERVAACIAAGTHEREYRVIPRPGAVRWLRTQGKVFRDASGAAVRLTGSIADITERRLATEALAVSEARYARAMEASEAGHFEWDIATDEMFLSARMKVMLGFAPDTPFANRAEFVEKQNFLSGERERLERALRGSFVDPEGRYEIDYRIRLPSGEERWMRSQGKLFRDADGKPVRMAGSMTDVTERKRIEHESRSRQEMLEVAQQAARAVQWEWRNAAGPWSQKWSPELEAMFGLQPGAYDGTFAAWRKMVHLDDWANVKSAIAHALATGEIDVEYRVLHPDGRVRWLNQKGRTFLGDDGKPVRSIGFMFDVTERKEAEAELRQLEQKLRRSQRLEAMGTLAGGIAHDFNNILHAILGYGEIAAGAAKNGTRLRHAVDSIVAAGERGRALVDRILAFSRSGAGERTAVPVEEVVREALNQLAATLPDNVTVVPRLRAGRAAMLGDSTQVHQVVANLANNAVQAMPHGGVLRVALEVEHLDSPRVASVGTIAAGDYIVLRVSDTGTGIPPAVFEHMFDPFFTT